jgi:hypothetical protein
MTEKFFLSFSTDDGIVEEQLAIPVSGMLTEVSAAPSNLNYIVSGIGSAGDISISSITFNDLGRGRLSIPNNNIVCNKLSSTSSVDVSSNVGLQCSSTSSIHTSASVGIDGDLMPTPAPSIWLRMEADGATHVSERDFGFDVAVIGVSSVPNYFAWDDAGSNNRLFVSADGVYKITANCSVISDTTIEVSLNLKINSNIVHYATQMVHTLTDPHRVDLTYVGVVRKNQAIQLTRTADGSAAIAIKKFSTLLIERVG